MGMSLPCSYGNTSFSVIEYINVVATSRFSGLIIELSAWVCSLLWGMVSFMSASMIIGETYLWGA